MAVSSGMVFRQPLCFSSAGRSAVGIPDAQSSLSCCYSEACFGGAIDFFPSLSIRASSRKGYLQGCSGYRDKGHLEYYYRLGGIVKCDGEKKQKKEIKEEKKKKLKLLKGLSKDLLSFSRMSLGIETGGDALADGGVQGKLISDAAEVLMKQLQELRAQEKELKRKKKEEKAKLKARMIKDESSSSSSSDSECGDVIDMSRLRNNTTTFEAEADAAQPMQNAPAPPPISSTSTFLTMPTQDEIHDLKEPRWHNGQEQILPMVNCSDATRNSRACSSSSAAGTKQIEVCMGNKCRKSGGVALLEEFEKVAVGLGGDAAMVGGCKCMGKCRDGPNVRVQGKDLALCIGVGLEDVGLIMANFLAQDQGKDLGLAPLHAQPGNLLPCL